MSKRNRATVSKCKKGLRERNPTTIANPKGTVICTGPPALVLVAKSKLGRFLMVDVLCAVGSLLDHLGLEKSVK